MAKEYLNLLAKREYRVVLGPRFVNLWLLVIVLVATFVSISFSNGSMLYLSDKMNDPFTNWLNIEKANEEDDFKGFEFKAYISNITSEKTLILKIYNKDKKELKKQEVKINYTPTTRLYTYNLAIDKKIKKEDVLYYSVEIKESE